MVDQFARPLEYRQRLQAQEVHFHQADLVAGGAVPLCDGVVAATQLAQRDDILQRLIGNDYPAGVHAAVSREALQLAGVVDQLVDLRVRFVEGLHIRLAG